MPKTIERGCYAMKTDSKSETAELTLYGNVVKKRPLDIDWENDRISKSTDNYIVEQEFLDDLKAIGECKKLNIRVNSLGGDVHVAMTIYSRLRELADNGTALNCIVDGVAMSAGSMIMCAADKVTASEASLIMIHRSMTMPKDYLNADELRRQAEIQDEYDKVIASCYKRKTGKSESELLKMMSRETYMTGAEAKEAGFVDELASSGQTTEIAACADKKSLLVGGRVFDLMGAPLPLNLPTVTQPSPQSGGDVTHKELPTEGGNEIMATNYDELLKENPALAAAIEKEFKAKAEADISAKANEAKAKAIEDERARIAAIDEIAALYSPETVEAAKYGEKACTAMELSYRAAVEDAKKGRKYLADIQGDAQASGSSAVNAAVPPADNKPDSSKTDEELMAEARVAVNAILKEEDIRND